nr:4-alpha-glucanotransferase [Blastocatellia bacterium]
MRFPRASGILLHLTSLPGRFGIGDMGPEARKFAEFLGAAGQTYWQVLPLGPTGYGDSPYQAFSAFAGNVLLISPEDLVEEGLLDAGDLEDVPEFAAERVDYGGVYEWKSRMLAEVCAGRGDWPEVLGGELKRFAAENWWWLDDFALFTALRKRNGYKAWFEWPDPLRLREPGALAAARSQYAEDVELEKAQQFLFFRQLERVREYIGGLGIKLIGDVPLFVALDSADVWCNQDKFQLNADGSPKSVAAVPPDYFSAKGQLWGNPLYDWNRMREDEFGWWTARFEFAMRTFDVLRIDHFRGFCGVWAVPGKNKTAVKGSWTTDPGVEVFAAVKAALGELPFIAEDLGHITPDVVELREEFGFPGMKILQYAFGGDAGNEFLPHNFSSNCVVYTGTHDNDTTRGWWDAMLAAEEEPAAVGHLREYLGTEGD